MDDSEDRRRSLETVSDSESARGTIVLYHSTSSSVSEQESEAAEKVELIAPDPRIESKYKKSRAKKDKLKRVLKSIYDINPDPRVPSRRQLSNQFWETRFEKNKVFQNNPDYIFESDGESDDEEAMRRPRGPRRGRGSRYYKKIHGMRPTLRTYVVDEDGEKYWYLDKQGRIIRCMFNCCEGFVGEIRIYTFFLLSMFYLGCWILFYTAHAASWGNRVKPFLVGSWTEVHTYPYGGPTVTRTITGHIVTYGTPRRYTATTTTAPDYEPIKTPDIGVWY
ncbi:hypothetical protein AOL_s00043g311 [Orbilia oligospora ATCC 24927]|uniref:Uncharacterized protein n=2 Tax=Orbilia oligospora TaxID=2813651 RepID=G1X3N7_ARTOA|nr:hypothetical protein AOL_s00043g311 [Orbilia oligospora ATCC 24927]EGX52168.1 hypothetical protein AOL_s00043g311 [Orbilia oligospora ATCC 24927]KAF3289400.1 hypothetical protein TWF970_003180 [Orbilia oligospora]